MAVIHSLPSRIDTAGAARLAAALKLAMESGEELGPRTPQIRAIGNSLERLGNELRQSLEEIDGFPEGLDPNTRILLIRLETFVVALLKLARLAQAQ